MEFVATIDTGGVTTCVTRRHGRFRKCPRPGAAFLDAFAVLVGPARGAGILAVGEEPPRWRLECQRFALSFSDGRLPDTEAFAVANHESSADPLLEDRLESHARLISEPAHYARQRSDEVGALRRIDLTEVPDLEERVLGVA